MSELCSQSHSTLAQPGCAVEQDGAHAALPDIGECQLLSARWSR
jgi:hypothetical protein